MLDLYPSPVVNASCLYATCTAWSAPFTNVATVDYGQMRIDQNISASDTLFGRYTIDNTSLENANTSVGTATTGVAFPQFGLVASGRNQFTTVAENHIFSPTVLNTARLSFSRTTVTDMNTYTPTAGDPSLSSSIYQMVAGVPVGDIVLSGFSGQGGNSGFGPPNDGQIQTVYTLSDDLFYTHGKHAFKFGVLVNRYNQGIDGGLRTEGQVTFPTMANFLSDGRSSHLDRPPRFHVNTPTPKTTGSLLPLQHLRFLRAGRLPRDIPADIKPWLAI